MNYALSLKFSYFWLFLLLCLAVFIRVQGADQYYYHPDEVMHVDIAKGNSLNEVMRYSLYETHPPLGHIVRHYWLKFSEELWFQRSLSLVFGLCIIALYYRMGCFIRNPFAGLCLAALATFSDGLIIQSYVIRNYTIFIFFISLAFYFYLHWRRDRINTSLGLYCIAALLAVFTHFSAIFAIFVLAAYETIACFFGKKKSLGKWVIVNILIALVYGIVCYTWQGTNSAFTFAAFYKAYIVKQKNSIQDLLVSAALFPVLASYYILPSKAFLCGLSLFTFAAKREERYLTFILFTSFVVGILLVVSGSYQFLASRRSLWAAPFILVATGVALAQSLEIFAFYLARKKPFYWFHTMVIGLTLAGFLFYDKQARFAERFVTGESLEYNHTSKIELDAIAHYISLLDNNYAVILDRGKIFLFAPVNPYTLLNENSLKQGAFVSMPYEHAKLVFAASYYGFDMLEQEQLWSALREVKKLVFLKSPFEDEFVDKIEKCRGVPHETVAFTTSALLLFDKQDFYENMILPGGKYHDCIK